MKARRQFLLNASATAIGFAGLRSFSACAAKKESQAITGYGDLQSDPEDVIDLPKGFSYRIIGKAGEKMDDGLNLPGAPDGMATFKGPDDLTLLVRNHEVNAGSGAKGGAFGSGNKNLTDELRKSMYDSGKAAPSLGGTSTVVYDTKKQKVVRQFLSLAGTLRNCAGGPTPWDSWVTCEETVEKAGKLCAKDHGWCFEVPATDQPKLADPVPLKGMGRFNHEAIAVDPDTGYVYETEDRHDGLIYRFLPKVAGKLAQGGKLQALVAKGKKSLDTRNWEKTTVRLGEKITVTWMDVDDVESPKDDLRFRGFAAGAARFARGEGMWYGNNGIYFTCTNGGKKKYGQVWKLTGNELELFAEPNDKDVVDNCDNLTVAPWGDVILCEDGSGKQYLVGVTPKGKFYKLARNSSGGSELAGATFSPDGSTLFVNIQGRGLTLAVTGPWVANRRES
jgi:uncharacterized protein